MSGGGGRKQGPDWWLVEVPPDEDGTRIDRFLRRIVPGLAQGRRKDARSGLIRLDGGRRNRPHAWRSARCFACRRI